MNETIPNMMDLLEAQVDAANDFKCDHAGRELQIFGMGNPTEAEMVVEVAVKQTVFQKVCLCRWSRKEAQIYTMFFLNILY